MNLVLSDDQQLIREEASRLLREKASPQNVRRIVEAGTGFDAALWSMIAGELGWCAMAVPEAYGGLGLGLTERLLLVEAVGERLAPVPLWSTTCAAAPLLEAIGSRAARERYLPAIAEGRIAATIAWGRIDASEPLQATGVTSKAVDGGYLLDGHVGQVIDQPAADLLLVSASADGEQALFALEREAGYESRQLETLDGTRPIAELTLNAQFVPDASRVDDGGFDASSASSAIAIAQLGLAAEQIGAARGVMDLTLAYVAERVQFGRTIASFQAVKHRCARLEVDLAEAKALIYGTAAGFPSATPEERLLEASGARALASNLLFRAAEESIQLHGGVGFTWEYDPHLYFKRAQATCTLLGSEEAHLEAIAARLLDKEAAA